MRRTLSPHLRGTLAPLLTRAIFSVCVRAQSDIDPKLTITRVVASFIMVMLVSFIIAAGSVGAAALATAALAAALVAACLFLASVCCRLRRSRRSPQ